MRFKNPTSLSRALLLALLLASATLFGCGSDGGGEINAELARELEPLADGDEISVIVFLRRSEKTDTSSAPAMASTLRTADATARRAVTTLARDLGARDIRELWLVNGLAMTATRGAVLALVRDFRVESIDYNTPLSLPESWATQRFSQGANLQAVGATELWDMGYFGDGVVVAVVDSGVDATHPELADNYRGGTNSWFDPYGEHAEPHDSSDSHGTAVAGILAGATTGVAPQARWIACRMYDSTGLATEAKIHECLQWLLDPDSNPATDDAPDVVNNSWGYSSREGECLQDELSSLAQAIDTLRQAGIAMVFASGNGGLDLSPANFPGVFSVGSADADFSTSNFSGRGPSSCDGSLYPTVVAPGESITAPVTPWYEFSQESQVMEYTGTSFSAPHVAGVMALLKSAAPSATVPELESAITRTALDTSVSGPDTDSGHGFVDARRAFLLLTGAGVCLADIDDDGFVDRFDQDLLLDELGRTDCALTGCSGDLDADGDVDGTDLLLWRQQMEQPFCDPAS